LRTYFLNKFQRINMKLLSISTIGLLLLGIKRNECIILFFTNILKKFRLKTNLSKSNRESKE